MQSNLDTCCQFGYIVLMKIDTVYENMATVILNFKTLIQLVIMQFMHTVGHYGQLFQLQLVKLFLSATL